MDKPWILLPCVVLAVYFLSTSQGCSNECASVVSKCMLIEACMCNMVDKSNCSCCKGCQSCLKNQYFECCSCVGMCPDPGLDPLLTKTSSIENLADPIPELFKVLTEDVDPQLRWSTYSYPAHEKLFIFKQKNMEFQVNLETKENGEVKVREKYEDLIPSEMHNCTVAFMSECLALHKCKSSCKSMGAGRFRWFHDQGCCQCISSECLDYGIDESLCLKCSGKEDEEEEGAEDHGKYDETQGDAKSHHKHHKKDEKHHRKEHKNDKSEKMIN